MASYSPRIAWTLAGSLMIALSALISIAIYGSLPYIPAQVSIGDWPVGGLTVPELERLLHEKTSRLMDQKLRLSVKSDTNGRAAGAVTVELKLGQLGLEVKEQEVTDRLRPLREGSPFRKAVYKWQIRGASWTLSRGISEDKLTAALKQAFPHVYQRQPVNAQRLILADDSIQYVPEIRVERIDEGALKNDLEAILPTWGSPRWAGDALCGTMPEPGASAGGQAQPFSVNVPMKVIEPQITVQHLKSQGIVRKISEFTTAYPPNLSPTISSEGRVHNVRSTAASIQDVLLGPGEVFDYARFIEQTEKKYGFKEAPVILNGKLVPGIGGGICQVSSTLYNAVLRAGLAVVERRNHSLPVSYVPLGQDATFASDYINFKFRNSTEHALLIRTAADDRSLTVKLFGQTPPDISYEVESKTVETLQPPVKYVLNPALPIGKQEVLSQGKPGYVVETYRYKRQNGVTVSQEKISRDTYSAQPTIVASNSGANRMERMPSESGGGVRKPLIEDGVKGPTFR